MEQSEKQKTLSQPEIFDKVNENTERYFGPVWLKNARENFYNLKHYKNLRSMPLNNSKVAMICGSGPSLENHLELIKKYRDNLTLLVADTAFPILIKNDIYPDYTINLDAADISSCFAFKPFNRMPKATLIASTITHPNLLSMWGNKNIYLYNLYDPNIPTLHNISLMFKDIPPIESKYNVGEFILWLATRYLSFKELALVGIDLCYLNNKIYSDGIGHKVTHDDSKHYRSMINNKKQMVYTTPIFMIYAAAFMEHYKTFYSKRKLYNLCEGIIPLKYQQDEFVARMEKLNESSSN